MKKQVNIHYELLSRKDFPKELRALFNEAEQAILSSHAPYSSFHVGAALLLDDGRVIGGSNQENAAYPIGYCAERTALSAKISSAPSLAIHAIAIATMNKAATALPPIAPCGLCRQALLEEEIRQDKSIKVYLLGNNDEVMVLENVSDLLPFRFDGSVL